MRNFLTALASVLLIVLSAGSAAAQSTPTPTIPRPAAIPFAEFTPVPTVEPLELRSRDRSDCGTIPADWVPFRARVGDSLPHLLGTGMDWMPVQVARANCLMDSGHLPVGAIVWLPPDAFASLPALPAAPSPSAAPAAIMAFSIDSPASPVQSTDAVTLTWDAVGTYAELTLCPADATAECPPGPVAARVPLTGSLPISGFAVPGAYRWRLTVTDAAGETVSREATVTVTCAHPSLFPLPTCPEFPLISRFAVYQPFEHGHLIYFGLDEASIFALLPDGSFTQFTDTYQEGMPDPGDAEPDGLITPVRGFGQVWRTLGGPDAPLGFGLQREQGFDVLIQVAGRFTLTIYLDTPGGVFALTAVPGRSGGYWSLVE